uniref:Protein kinase domain-containing protein n=1 Tax=Oryzias sinensis TaxID=183150 RepID=A0A8C8DZ23_9TELE
MLTFHPDELTLILLQQQQRRNATVDGIKTFFKQKCKSEVLHRNKCTYLVSQPFTFTATNFYRSRTSHPFADQQVGFIKRYCPSSSQGGSTSRCFNRYLSSSPASSATKDFLRNFPHQFSKDYSTYYENTMILVKKKVEIKEGTILHSSKASYQLGTFLDDGSYGKVLRGKKLRTNEDVAIKIIKGDYLEAGPMEFKALQEIKRIKADKNNLIKCIDRFNYRNRAFIVFEMLDQNLHHFLSKRKFSPLGISEIKVISRQLLVALKALKSIGLVHTDIKLDNIMLVDHKSQPFRVKLIDFGLASKLEDLETGSIFQTMPYRAPEVRLGLPLNEGVDMWALGHTLAMLLKGSSLYPCDSDYNVIRAMVNMQGMPKNSLLDQGLYSDKFFTMNSEGKWKLDSPIEHVVKTGKKVKLDKRHCSSFEEILQERNGQVELFVNLLEQMLLIDPYRRITPEEALQHSFFTENNDDNNQIVKAVSGIANKRSAMLQDPISQQDKTIVGKDCSRKYVDRNKDKICLEKCVRVPSCLEILKFFHNFIIFLYIYEIFIG